VDARDEYGQTALIEAAWSFQNSSTAEHVKVLLDAVADASLKDNLGKTAWDYAQTNEGLKDTDAYWMLNDARFK
jgi:ankyrin repeat protein